MPAERELFIDIDREPENGHPRLSGMPAAQQGSASHLWPPPAASPASQDRRDVRAAPSISRRIGDLAALPTMPLDLDLVESLAALAPKSTATRPLSLAEALAAMQTPAPPITSEPNTPPPAAEPLPGPPEPPAGRANFDQIYRVRVSAAGPLALPEELSPQEPPDDTYLARSYDLTRLATAELYERAIVPLWSAPFGRMLLSAFQGCPRQPGWQVVDVGCGTGYPTLEVAKLLEPDGDVAGVDVWGAGIEHAQARARELRLNNVAFLVADVASCDLPECSFDTAICNLGLTSFAQPDAALKGIARLLQPNGTLILTTSLRGTMQEFFETYRAVLNDLGLLDLGWDVERLIYLQPTLERVEALLDMAGFTVDQTLSDHFALEFPDGGAFLRSPLVGMRFLHRWRNVIGDLSLRRVVFNEVERRLNARAAAWGRLDLIVPMLCVTARRRAQG
ncbi:MAG TPA: class I SAM-dependent methyltransferase [Ktedonobacterales bacterium]|jgi:ubiquinone/menaquinone biosynthesis C-methylase UbiE